MGLRPGRRHATAAGVAETAGGALLTLGAPTPVAAATITGVMITAIRKVHAPNGPWVTEGGYEYNLALIGLSAALAETGPGARRSTTPGSRGCAVPRSRCWHSPPGPPAPTW